MERGNDNDVFGHDLWGGSVPDSTPQKDNSRNWQNQLYQGFQQQYNLEAENLRRSMQVEHNSVVSTTSQCYEEKLRIQAAQHDFERSQWNEKLESIMNAWQEETNLVVAKEKESTQIQISTLKSVFQQQLLDSIKKVADLEKKVAILENEKAQAFKEVELVSSRYGLRLRELEQQLTQSQIIFEHEKEKLEREITKVQSISDGRGMEVQRLQHLINGGSNQRLSRDDSNLVLDENSYTNPMVENEHAEERYMSASDNSSVITERANLQRDRSEGSVSSGFIARINMLTSREANSTGKSRHKLPLFNANGSLSQHEWLRHFEKLIAYYNWDDHTALLEMQISMTGEADNWFLHLPSSTTSSLTLAKAAFQKNFGGAASERAQAATELNSMRKGNESMETFGPRVKSKIMKIVPGEDEHSLEAQLSLLYPTMGMELVKYVSAQRTKSVAEAIEVAVEIERGIAFANRVKDSGKKLNVLPIPMATATSNHTNSGGDGPTAMEIDVQRINAQHYKNNNYGAKSFKSGNAKTNKTCHACQKTGHLVKDCYLVRQAQDMKKPKDRSYRNNTQQVTVVDEGKGGINLEISNADLDITNNLFYQVGGLKSNSQILSENDFIPTFTGGGSDPRSFSVPALAEFGHETECLVDTGAMMSSILPLKVKGWGLK